MKRAGDMIFSKKSRYGIRALIDLAQNSENCCVQLSNIADRNNIPVKYLEQIFIALRKAGILRSIKGPQGGYFFARKPNNLKIAEIISALDGDYLLEAEETPNGGKGESEALAIQTEIIDPINEWMDAFLNTLTLKDLIKCSEKLKGAAQDMYYI